MSLESLSRFPTMRMKAEKPFDVQRQMPQESNDSIGEHQPEQIHRIDAYTYMRGTRHCCDSLVAPEAEYRTDGVVYGEARNWDKRCDENRAFETHNCCSVFAYRSINLHAP
jgi:hypothetical protein